MKQPWNLYELETPRQWRAGFAGRDKQPIHFACGRCGAKDAVIHGFIVAGPTFLDIAVVRNADNPFVNPALLCADCFKTCNLKLQVSETASEISTLKI